MAQLTNNSNRVEVNAQQTTPVKNFSKSSYPNNQLPFNDWARYIASQVRDYKIPKLLKS